MNYPNKQQNFSEFIPFLLGTQVRAVHRRHKKNIKHKDNLIKTYLRFCSGENRRNYVYKHLLICPDKHLCFLAGKSHPTLLRYWVPNFCQSSLYPPLYHYSRLFANVRHYSLFAIRDYSLFDSGFPGLSRQP